MSKKTSNIVPQVSRLESFLDSSQMVENPISVFEKYRKEHGPTFMFYFGGTRRTLVTTDPEIIQHVLKDNQNNYNKSDIQVKRMAEFQGQGLLNSHGEYWLKQRRLLSKGFTHSHLTKLLPIQTDVLNDFMIAFEKHAIKGSIDIHHEMVKFTLRSIGKSLFGNGMKDDDIDMLGATISNIQEFMVKQIVQPYLIPWFRISGETDKFQKIRIEADQLIMAYVDQRRKEESKYADMLQILLEIPYNTGELMTDDQVMIETLQLLVAGNETSSNVLSWTFYLLAKHPEYINKIREEIEVVFGKEKIDYAGLHKLDLTVNVLDEAMRLYPPFWMIDRVALNDDDINGIHISKDTMVVPYIYGVHHNAAIWNNPENFDPSRFDKINKGNRHSFAHIPFGGGPRVCIGQNMAMMQILLVLMTVVRKYDFKLSEDEAIGINPMMILRPNGPIKLEFKAI